MKKRKVFIILMVMTFTMLLFIAIINPKSRYNEFEISENSWNSIIEKRKNSNSLKIENMRFNDYGLIIDDVNCKLYYSLINESRLKYNPLIWFVANERHAKLAILKDDITEEKTKFNHEFKIMIYSDKEYKIYSLICTDMPMLNIISPDEEKGFATIFLMDNLTNKPNKITISDAKINKDEEDNYIFSLEMRTPGKNIRKNKVSLFNMPPESDYILEVSKTERDSINVELFTNNKYVGRYTLKPMLRGWKNE